MVSLCSYIITDLSNLSTYLNLLVALLIMLAVHYYIFRSQSIYLIDFSCYQPPNYLRVPASHFIEHFALCSNNKEAVDFQTKVLERSGISSETAFPIGVHQIPRDETLRSTRDETESILFAVVNDLLHKTNVNPKNIDIIISNCSLFCPTPSISDMIINKFGLRSNVKSVSLSGMGCSAGLLSISLAKELLKVHKKSLALVLSMEATTPNTYKGKNKSMLLANVLFRMGGVAILLSNQINDKWPAKYKLQHLVRTHMGSDDQSYMSVFQQEDESGLLGISLSRTLLIVAGKALKENMTRLGPLVLPYSEQLLYVLSVFCGKISRRTRHNKIYVPNFRKAVKHFCIHAGGRAVIDAVAENLGLSKEDAEASRMTLYRFGNTSSSSIWYELCYLEAKGRVQKGDHIWQIAFGSGFKCNSAIWKCIEEPNPHLINAWSDRIHLYPVEIPNFIDH